MLGNPLMLGNLTYDWDRLTLGTQALAWDLARFGCQSSDTVTLQSLSAKPLAESLPTKKEKMMAIE